MSPARQALIVAVDDYVDPGLRRLRAPSRDAEVLAEVLGAPAIGDFGVDVLRNASAHEIRIAIEDFFADRRPDDLLLLHFSGHGLKSAGGELFLAATDSRPTRLASTAVAADFVNQQMAQSRAQRIALFLDCCYGGAFPRGMVVRGAGDVQVGDAFAAAQRAAGGRGRVVVTASSAVEYAFEGDELTSGSEVGPSVFTGSLVEGLSSGEADRDGDGWVGLNELFAFVSERVRQRTPHQTPHLWAFGSEGDLLLAHSRQRRITAEALPAELAEAVRSPLAAARFGVAVELADRASGAELGQALGAWTVLTGMAQDDSRRVAGVVEAAVRSARLEVEPPALELGSAPVGARAEGELQLRGSPLALAVTGTSPDSWLRVEVDGALVRVVAVGAAAGAWDGTVVLTSPIGEVVVPVHVDVRAVGAGAGAGSAGVPSPVRTSVEHTVAPEVPVVPATAAENADGPRWWPVAVSLLLAAAGLAVVQLGLEDVWRGPGTGAAVLLACVIAGALRWPRLESWALGLSCGLGLYCLVLAAMLLLPSLAHDSDVSVWTRTAGVGLLTVVLVAVPLARTGSFRRTGESIPATRDLRLLLAASSAGAAALVFAVVVRPDGSSSVLDVSPWFLLAPLVAVALAGAAIASRGYAVEPVAHLTSYAFLGLLVINVVNFAARGGEVSAPYLVGTIAGAVVLVVAVAGTRTTA